MNFQYMYLLIIFQLILLEGLLSFDNALALAALVKRRLKNPLQQKKALLYGIWGAYFFRVITIFLGVWLMKHEWVKAAAGSYLVILAVYELFFHKKTVSLQDDEAKGGEAANSHLPPPVNFRSFLITIVHVEIMDIMFSIDAIAVALAISDVKWVLITGAILGMLIMRIAAQFFIKLIDIFPILIKTSFVLVGIAGFNVLLKLKDLNLGFTSLTIDSPMPEGVFLSLLISVFLGSLVLNKMFPERFRV